MKRYNNPFKNGMRVTVNIPQLAGKLGTVVIARKHSEVVWVQMDDPLPDGLRTFHSMDARANHIVVPVADVIVVC